MRIFLAKTLGVSDYGHRGQRGSHWKYLNLMPQVKVNESSFEKSRVLGEGWGDRGRAGVFPRQQTPRGAGICCLLPPVSLPVVLNDLTLATGSLIGATSLLERVEEGTRWNPESSLVINRAFPARWRSWEVQGSKGHFLCRVGTPTVLRPKLLAWSCCYPS